MGDKIIEGEFALGPPSPSVVAVAIDGDIKSKHVVKWALDKFAPKRKVLFKLLHVRPTITNVPTPSKSANSSIKLQTIYQYYSISTLMTTKA